MRHSGNRERFSLFVGFRETSWEVEYVKSVRRIATQTAVDRESALDMETILYVVNRSINHDKAKLAIATQFAHEVTAFLNESFDLRLTISIEGYSKGNVHGHVTQPRTVEETVDFVEAQMAKRCGFIPGYATPLDGINLFEWLLWCAETLDYPEPDYVPGDEVYLYLAERYQRTDAVLRHVREALNTERLTAFLSRPVDAILERVLRG